VPGSLKGLQIFTMNNIIKSINTGTVVVRIQYHQQINHILSGVYEGEITEDLLLMNLVICILEIVEII
jgi:hypothetical protein